MADAAKSDVENALLKGQLAAALAKIELLQSKPGAAHARVHLGLLPEHKGTKTYAVGPSRHYRDGRIYQAGEEVTVTDERPAKDWVLADGSAPKAKPATAPASSRSSDKNVG